ncbi:MULTISPECIES: hypothetical protein [Kribbella]|nr:MULTISPECIES: hypothetical protein [Kribbella]
MITVDDPWPPALDQGSMSSLPAGQIASLYDRLLDRLKEINDASRKSILGLLLVTTAVELLNRAAISNVAIGGFEVSDLSVVRKILPMVAAYFIYDLVVHGFRFYYTRAVVSEIDRIYSSQLSAHRLTRISYPIAPSLFGPLAWYQSKSSMFPIVAAFNVVLRAGTVLTPLLLELWWYTKLFNTFGLDDVLLWVSSSLSAAFIAFAAVLVVEGVKRGVLRRENFFQGR